MTAVLEGGEEWSAARPGRTLPPGKIRYPFYRRLGGPQGRSGRAENLIPTGIRSRTVQPVGSHYINWATRPTVGWSTKRKVEEWAATWYTEGSSGRYKYSNFMDLYLAVGLQPRLHDLTHCQSSFHFRPSCNLCHGTSFVSLQLD